MTINDIINWCLANNQVEWLQNKVEEKVACKVYPKMKQVAIDKVTGEPKRNKKGELVYTSVANKNATPKTEYRPISFIQIKTDFVNQFMPEIAPVKKAKKLNMYDLIKAL